MTATNPTPLYTSPATLSAAPVAQHRRRWLASRSPLVYLTTSAALLHVAAAAYVLWIFLPQRPRRGGVV